MRNRKSPFEIDAEIMTHVMEISELVGRVSVAGKTVINPRSRRTNRIRTIYSSLAIE